MREAPHSVKMIAASINKATGQRIYTFELRYWRAFHAELMTHRMFSRNAGSSRAIPVAKMLSQVWNHPAGPTHWGVNQPGMQARAELKGFKRWLAPKLWRFAGRVACVMAWSFMKLGVHKQVANRLLEPWQFINVVVTATEWDNFFALRCHPDAMPEFQALARDMQWTISATEDFLRVLEPGEWHLPYVTDEERRDYSLMDLIRISVARCARVSYTPFTGEGDVQKDFELHDKLVMAVPPHMSPTEHQAMATAGPARVRNFFGFAPYRGIVEAGTP